MDRSMIHAINALLTYALQQEDGLANVLGGVFIALDDSGYAIAAKAIQAIDDRERPRK
jgi:hypothetical protein